MQARARRLVRARVSGERSARLLGDLSVDLFHVELGDLADQVLERRALEGARLGEEARRPRERPSGSEST
jgi:hypothetical protein